MQLGLRVTERVCVTGRFVAPLPYALDVNSWFMAGVGVSARVF